MASALILHSYLEDNRIDEPELENKNAYIIPFLMDDIFKNLEDDHGGLSDFIYPTFNSLAENLHAVSEKTNHLNRDGEPKRLRMTLLRWMKFFKNPVKGHGGQPDFFYPTSNPSAERLHAVSDKTNHLNRENSRC